MKKLWQFITNENRILLAEGNENFIDQIIESQFKNRTNLYVTNIYSHLVRIV